MTHSFTLHYDRELDKLTVTIFDGRIDTDQAHSFDCKAANCCCYIYDTWESNQKYLKSVKYSAAGYTASQASIIAALKKTGLLPDNLELLLENLIANNTDKAQVCQEFHPWLGNTYRASECC